MAKKQPESEPAPPEPKGGNGQGGSEPDESEPGRIKVELTPEVHEWWPYFGRPLVVQLKEGMVVVDCIGAIEMPLGREGTMRPVGVPGSARPRDPETNRPGKGVITDLFEGVMMQPSPCGKKLMLLQRTDTMPGGTGAMIAYTIRPDDVRSVAHVEVLPQKIEQPSPRRIIAP